MARQHTSHLSRPTTRSHQPVSAWLLIAALCAAFGQQAAQAAGSDTKIQGHPPIPAAAPAAASQAEPGIKAPVVNSELDGQLFYQTLIAEIKANEGDLGTAYQVYLEAARKHPSNQVYQRAVELALRGRAGEQALAAAKAWRQALPQSREASQFTAQILLALGRTTDLAAPLRSLVQLTPAPQQPQTIAGLARMTSRLADKQAAAQVIEEATQPWRQAPMELPEAWTACAEAWMLAKDAPKATAALQRAFALKPQHAGAGIAAIELMSLDPKAEDLVKAQLARPDAPDNVRITYARRLAGVQRFDDSAAQLEALVKDYPNQTVNWLTLAAVRLELKQYDKAEQALQPVLATANRPKPADAPPSDIANEVEQAYLLMAQVSEQRQKFDQAAGWLDRADPKHEKLTIQVQRARLLVRNGKLPEARKLLRSLPEAEPRDALTKIQAETQLLREAQQWDDAYKVMQEAAQRFPEDSDVLYDFAMMGEKLKKFDEMEATLRKVMTLAPESPNAYNALGYSFADRGIRLPEARKLIEKALELRPGDPFITDSMGWLEFRSGNPQDAVRLLREAYNARPDAEIAAHLGEVMWSINLKDDARKIWREAYKEHTDNDTLNEVMKRFKVTP